jgi:histidinol-phosphate phosphatase family protein
MFATRPNLRPAVFLDKDGTLVRDVPYNVDPRRIELESTAAEGLARLAEAGFALVVVSNQSGVARGIFEERALDAVEQRIRQLLEAAGIELAGFYYCPHHPAGTVAQYRVRCNCRKPAPGMLLQASRDLGLDLPESWLIGDILDDVEAGRAAGCRTVLIDAGHETQWVPGPLRTPHYIATDLADAARFIAQARRRSPSLEATS